MEKVDLYIKCSILRKNSLTSKITPPMLTTQDTGVYTKTGAFNLLKKWIGIPQKKTINKEVFSLCFKSIENFYISVVDEGEMKKIFSQHEIPKRNNIYWETKKSGKAKEAEKILNESIWILAEALAA